MRKTLFVALLLFSLAITAHASIYKVSSPDGKLSIQLISDSKGLAYEVKYLGNTIVGPSPLGFVFQDGNFGTRDSKVRTSFPRRLSVYEPYTLKVGKVRDAKDHCEQMTVRLSIPNGRMVDVVFRAYDDAVAFRYVFPEQAGWDSCIIKDECTAFDVTGNPKALYMQVPDFQTAHERPYVLSSLQEIPEGAIIDMPVTFQRADGIYVSITEAAIRDYAGMMLVRKGGSLKGELSPRLDDPTVKVYIDDFPHKTPWRVVMVSERIGDFIESTVLTSLCDPCEIEDTEWIRPCKTTFTWWNGNMVPDTTFFPGNNFETNKYYIDFASENGIDLHDIYGYAETPWYYDSNFNFGWSSDDADPTKPIACLDMDRIARYAAQKGMGLHLWVNWRPLYKHLDEAFALYHQWGVKGLMIDFLNRDDQEMIKIQEDFLKAAAKHELFVQFHGASKPSGLNRTYPNEFTREGVMNYEVCKWDSAVNPDHDISIPFTRMLAGPSDYHMGGFRADTRENFRPRYTNPHVMGTRCHMLGMYVVLENYLTSVCDTPEAYKGQKGFEFIKALPHGWEDVKVIDAGFNEYVAIARRNGPDWWIGAITNHDARRLDLDLSFLEEGGEYALTLFTDVPECVNNPNLLEIKEMSVKKGDTLHVALEGDGGAAAIVRRIR